MKAHLVGFVALFAVASGKPGIIAVAPVASSISSQYHAQDELGQYNYGYANVQSAKSEMKSADGITQGAYSYVDATGKLQNVQYTADDVNGFRVTASNMPEAVAPESVKDTVEVAEAKAKHMDAVKEAEARTAPTLTSYTSQFLTIPAVGYPIAQGYSYNFAIPAITAYTRIAPYYSQIAPLAYALPVLPAVPAETPEVAKARAEHLAAHAEAKARSL